MDQVVLNKVITAFTASFHEEPLVVFSPGRINFIGEHTDYNDGYVFPAAIDKGIYLAIGTSSDNRSEIRALDFNESMEFDVFRQEQATQGSWRDYFLGIIAELNKRDLPLGQIKVIFSGTIDPGSGMSSSAALENAFVFGLNELLHLGLSKNEMIYISQAAEHHYVGVKCGIMDQFASMFGLEGAALFLDCKTMKSEKHSIDMNGYTILLINSNVKHTLADSAYNQRRVACEQVASLLGKTTLREVTLTELEENNQKIPLKAYQKALYVVEENNRVLAFKEAVDRKDLKCMGELMYQSHKGLQNNYEVSCEELDFLVDFTRNKPYVLGSRMMGGGFGGCTINLVQSQQQEHFIKAISGAYYKRFQTPCTIINVRLSDGTKRIK